MNKIIFKNNSNKLIEIFINAITCTFLYNMAIFMPITGFLLLVYKIKNVSILNKKKWIVVNLLTLFFIMMLSIQLSSKNNMSVAFFRFQTLKSLLGYLLIFIPIELFYILFNTRKNLLPVFDRIIITGIIITGLTYYYLGLLNIDIEMIKNVMQQLNNFDKKTMAYALKYLKNNIFYLIYIYIGFIIYLTYYSLGKKSYTYWRISYIWLILYIIPFYIIKFGKIENIYLTNIMLIIKLSFVMYGVKTIFNFLKKRIKSDLICNVLAVLIGFSFQNITFIIAGIFSFEAIKIKIIKQSGGK